MILVDTSTWIDYYRNRSNPAAERLGEILERRELFAITGVIYQELLQGAADEREWRLLEEYFVNQHFLNPRDPVKTHRDAARMFFICRREGVTPRSTIDCLIARVAIEHQVPLLHNDRDYVSIGKIIPELQLLP
ncbi:MAG: PIN domain nuclease [Methylococcaceae bacterium]|nr:PIN domain nuclease [Methylococcaceae bacterium]